MLTCELAPAGGKAEKELVENEVSGGGGWHGVGASDHSFPFFLLSLLFS